MLVEYKASVPNQKACTAVVLSTNTIVSDGFLTVELQVSCQIIPSTSVIIVGAVVIEICGPPSTVSEVLLR